ncbi:MAG: adenine deaminase C-terminal domain-containing protein, partial [Chitinophagaceae bacterium]
SAAKNFDALIPLLHQYPDMIMFGSDDKHPDELAAWHINKLCARAVAKGIDVFHVLQATCVNPVRHYKMQVGQLHEGDAADFILVNNLREFDVLATYIDGQLVAENGVTKIPRTLSTDRPNAFNRTRIEPSALGIPANGPYPFPVIEALDGQLITNAIHEQPAIEQGHYVSDPSRDLLKIVVVNRYTNAPIAKAFIKNFGIKQGAIASSVAHDSHNIVAVGTDDESLCKSINLVIDHQGGVSCVKHNLDMVVPLPVAGLMSDDDGYKVAELYAIIDEEVKKAGSTLRSPFMTLSFMALLVIPALKLSDLGLFDGKNFTLLERGVSKPGIQ